MRQQYESQVDRDLEDVTAKRIAKISVEQDSWLNDNGLGFMTNTTMQKLPAYTYKLDWGVVRASPDSNRINIVAWAELKTRNIFYKQYPDVMISAHKVLAGVELSKCYKIPFVLFIGFTNGLGLHVFDTTIRDYQLCYGGRILNTRDAADVEPVCYVKMEDFYFFPN